VITWRHLGPDSSTHLPGGVPLILGLFIALPLGWLARRYKGLYRFLIIGTGLLYTIPSLALFIMLPFCSAPRSLTPSTSIIAMTISPSRSWCERSQTDSGRCPKRLTSQPQPWATNEFAGSCRGAAIAVPVHLSWSARCQREQR